MQKYIAAGLMAAFANASRFQTSVEDILAASQEALAAQEAAGLPVVDPATVDTSAVVGTEDFANLTGADDFANVAGDEWADAWSNAFDETMSAARKGAAVVIIVPLLIIAIIVGIIIYCCCCKKKDDDDFNKQLSLIHI